MLSTNELRSFSQDERLACRLLWLLTFLVFLPVAFAAMLTGWRWQPWPGTGSSRKSVMGEARSIADCVVGITFSAH